MNQPSRTPFSPPGQPPRFRGRLLSCTAIWLLAVWVGVPAVSLAQKDQPVHTFQLLPGVVAKVDADGALILSSAPGDSPLLTTEVVPLADSRRGRRRAAPPFTALVNEGAPGGQRGFSANRDDDQDGAVDEDVLDGQDNDGDGRVDEDFAAISDAMVVVHQDIRSDFRNDVRQGGGRSDHLEYYHWAYPHLRSIVFLAAQGGPGRSNGGTYRLGLGHERWHEATVVCNRHDLAARAEVSQAQAFVAQLTPPDRPAHSGRLWIGVVVLRDSPHTRAVLDDGVLDLPLTEEPLPLAICVAETWLQLNRMLTEAERVCAGVTDKLTGQKAPWIVPPLCSRCRLATPPAFSWTRTSAGDLQLTAHLAAAINGVLDPDLFRLSGQALGAPSEIHWQPDAGSVVTVPWMAMNATLLNRPHDQLSAPYARMTDVLNHQGSGQMRFTFSTPELEIPLGQDDIRGVYLDGRPFTAQLTAAPDAPPALALGDLFVADAKGAEPQGSDANDLELGAVPADQARLLNSGNQHPTLSPQLLEGFPNPFRDVIRLRFQVPATMGEAFVWDNSDEPPVGIDPRATVPWRSGTPNISLKIYSINGQELVTLYSGNQGPGENTVQWSGTDSFGHQVASGAYFCKLQLDDWSVTRRLVFLR